MRWSLQASISLTSFLCPPPPTFPATQCKWKSRGTESAPYPLCAGGPQASLLIALPVKYRLFLFLILIFFQKPNLFLLDITQILKPEFYLVSKGFSLNCVSKLPDINIH
ncbi:unnamed protein product [Rangifer tarandus platyrhynchus]|uniref:Uncharacterized protein n=1 Tax=Rangifer tarandus platyrhynchus TaxID=3082113 RepID=A0ABN9A2D7_RANTA|nr:unnamed protein product [Rangifer tarandus platyrhynchus]